MNNAYYLIIAGAVVIGLGLEGVREYNAPPAPEPVVEVPVDVGPELSLETSLNLDEDDFWDQVGVSDTTDP